MRVRAWSILAVLAVGCSLPSKFNVGPHVDGDAGLDATIGQAGSADGAVGQAGSGGHAGSGVGGTAGWGNPDAGGQAGADAGVSDASAGTGGVAGSSGAGGSSGADAGGGSAGVAGTGGTGGSSLDAGSDAQGGTGGSSLDAGSDAQIDAGDACTPITYYQDNDKDGYGGTTTVVACSPPSSGTWVTQGGDCDDNNNQVHPGQTSYFTTGYTPPGSSQISFDYNCDGSETESGSNSHLSCHWSTILCVGGGYLPVSPSRSGSGVDNYCGSSQQAGCWPTLSGCKAGNSYGATTIACH